jgi:hypothetical protein
MGCSFWSVEGEEWALAPCQHRAAERAIGLEGDPYRPGRVIIGLEALHRERLPLEIREEQGGGNTGQTKLSAPCKVPLERLGRPNRYRYVAAVPDHVDGLLEQHVTNA